jgi:alpha-D-ribose 1-methylphosphonate 5-triphosphate synthase subunit PhnL
MTVSVCLRLQLVSEFLAFVPRVRSISSVITRCVLTTESAEEQAKFRVEEKVDKARGRYRGLDT